MISLNTPNQNNKLALTIQDRAFVDLIQNRITMYGEIPYSLPELMIVDLIKSAAKLFLQYWHGATETSFYRLENYDIKQYAGTDKFQTLSVKIDPRIRTVRAIYETNSNQGRYSYDDGDKYETGTIAGASANRPELNGINNNLYLLEFAIKMTEQKAYDNIFSSSLPFDYSFETNTLLFKRQPTGTSIVLKVAKAVHIHQLYNNTFFERYVIANAKKELKRKIGSHTIELPGGATLNTDEVCAGMDDAETVEGIIKASSGIGDIILKRNR